MQTDEFVNDEMSQKFHLKAVSISSMIAFVNIGILSQNYNGKEV